MVSMSDYRRLYRPGGAYFFTVVTAARRPLFRDAKNVRLLRDAVAETKSFYPFEILASVIMPDHLHMIWRLPEADVAYSQRWSSVK